MSSTQPTVPPVLLNLTVESRTLNEGLLLASVSVPLTDCDAVMVILQEAPNGRPVMSIVITPQTERLKVPSHDVAKPLLLAMCRK